MNLVEVVNKIAELGFENQVLIDNDAIFALAVRIPNVRNIGCITFGHDQDGLLKFTQADYYADEIKTADSLEDFFKIIERQKV